MQRASRAIAFFAVSSACTVLASACDTSDPARGSGDAEPGGSVSLSAGAGGARSGLGSAGGRTIGDQEDGGAAGDGQLSAGGQPNDRPQGGTGGDGGAFSAAGQRGEQAESGAGTTAAGASGQFGLADGQSGTGGAGGTGGTGGTGAPTCEPRGAVNSLDFGNLPVVPQFCPNLTGLLVAHATSSDATFHCCGTSDSPTPYTTEILGTAQANGLVQLSFVLPPTTPDGLQTLDVVCAPGPTTTPLPMFASRLSQAIVTSVSTPVPYKGVVIAFGTNLGSGRIFVAPKANPEALQLCPGVSGQSESVLSCDLGPMAPGSMAPGDYWLAVRTPCGQALNVLPFTISNPLPPAAY